jgi:hypothetical protein
MIAFLKKLADKIKDWFSSIFKFSKASPINKKPEKPETPATQPELILPQNSYPVVNQKITDKDKKTPIQSAGSEITFPESNDDAYYERLDQTRKNLGEQIHKSLCKNYNGLYGKVSMHHEDRLVNVWKMACINGNYLPCSGTMIYDLFFNNAKLTLPSLQNLLSEFKGIIDNIGYRSYLEKKSIPTMVKETKLSTEFLEKDKKRNQLESDILTILRKKFGNSNLPGTWANYTNKKFTQYPWENIRFFKNNPLLQSCEELKDKIDAYSNIVDGQSYQTEYKTREEEINLGNDSRNKAMQSQENSFGSRRDGIEKQYCKGSL